jgi:hypothetical protein
VTIGGVITVAPQWQGKRKEKLKMSSSTGKGKHLGVVWPQFNRTSAILHCSIQQLKPLISSPYKVSAFFQLLQ